MRLQMMRKPPLIIVCVLLMLIAAAGVFWYQRLRPLPFDAQQWASGNQDLRFRMKDSLIAKYKAGEVLTRSDADRLLGPAEDGSDNMRRYLMKQWLSPWYLRVVLDEAAM